MNYYDIVFVVLVYGNSDDLRNYDNSLRVLDCNYKVVVVDAFFSEDTSIQIQLICHEINADYIKVDNKGYSYGNNIGINYTKSKYQFRFIGVSNPDIQIRKLDLHTIDESLPAVYGPIIKTRKGKCQNPILVKYSRIIDFLTYFGFRYNIFILIRICSALNRLDRELFLKVNSKKIGIHKVFALHGSLLLFSRGLLEYFKSEIFDEKMFLYCEEIFLGYRFSQLNIPMYYCNFMEAYHKEDGSINHNRRDVWRYTKESYIYYYENRIIKSEK